jgi:hypothetical protein
MLVALFKKELFIQARSWKTYASGAIYALTLSILAFCLIWSISTGKTSYNPGYGRSIFLAFIVGLELVISLICPVFTFNSISAERENLTFYQLKLTHLKSSHIIMAKAGSAILHILVLLFISIPVTILMMPLGGINWAQVGLCYIIILNTAIAFILTGLACSSIFKVSRNSASATYAIVGFFMFGTELIPLVLTEIFKIKSKHIALQILTTMDPARAVLNSLDAGKQFQIAGMSPWMVAILGYAFLSIFSICVAIYRIKKIK